MKDKKGPALFLAPQGHIECEAHIEREAHIEDPVRDLYRCGSVVKLIRYIPGIKAAATASTTAGSMLATLIFFPQTRFSPTQKINIDPIKER